MGLLCQTARLPKVMVTCRQFCLILEDHRHFGFWRDHKGGETDNETGSGDNECTYEMGKAKSFRRPL